MNPFWWNQFPMAPHYYNSSFSVPPPSMPVSTMIEAAPTTAIATPENILPTAETSRTSKEAKSVVVRNRAVPSIGNQNKRRQRWKNGRKLNRPPADAAVTMYASSQPMPAKHNPVKERVAPPETIIRRNNNVGFKRTIKQSPKIKTKNGHFENAELRFDDRRQYQNRRTDSRIGTMDRNVSEKLVIAGILIGMSLQVDTACAPDGIKLD